LLSYSRPIPLDRKTVKRQVFGETLPAAESNHEVPRLLKKLCNQNLHGDHQATVIAQYFAFVNPVQSNCDLFSVIIHPQQFDNILVRAHLKVMPDT